MSVESLSRSKTPWFFLDFKVLKSILMIAIPITLQTILFSSKGLTDVMMVGQLSEDNLAAMGVAGRALFVAIIVLSGVSTGGAMLAAQFYGANNHQGVTSSVALTWVISTAVAILPIGLFWFYGDWVIGLSSQSLAIQALGHDYLKWAGLSLFFVAFSGAIAAGLRSIHQAALSTWFSALGIVLNLFFNWVFIFGNLGAPELGLKGAAVATVLSSFIEVLVTICYLVCRKHLLAFTLSDVLSALQIEKIKRFVSLALPTTLNFLLWAGGLFTYTAIMGKTGDQGLVVLSVITPIEAFSLSFLTGIANASAVIVGNQLGAKNDEAAYSQAVGFVLMAIAITLLVSVSLYLLRAPILGLFGGLEEDTYILAEKFYLILCIGIVMRSLPTTMVVGVLRAGGDVKFCLYQDLTTQWLFGIPLAALGAFVFGLSLIRCLPCFS